MKDLKEIERLYKCFASRDKLRIWNLLLPHSFTLNKEIVFDHPIIASDLSKTITEIKPRSIFMYLNEFAENGLIHQDTYGKNKLYYFSDDSKQRFVQNIIDQIKDPVLLQDCIQFELKYRGHFLII